MRRWTCRSARSTEGGAALLVGALLLAGCAGSGSSQGTSTTSASTGGASPTGSSGRGIPSPKVPGVGEAHAVGIMTATFVDMHRKTAANGPSPALSSRTLVTTILYPAQGPAGATTPAAGAPPDRAGGPYPLIVFAHGLGATPSVYDALLTHWAAAGFVVAAPLFPLTSGETPGGTDAGDVANQPGDMSYVVTSLLRASSSRTGALAGMVDPSRIGAAGHSNGAITTLGLVANTCCRDPRIRAAAVLAGDLEGFEGGRYDLSVAPPVLVVHGTADELIPYDEGVRVFNEARGPKGLLTIEGGDHDSAGALSGSSAQRVEQATTDFFSAYLGGDPSALARLQADGQPGVTTMRFYEQPGSTATVATVPTPTAHLRATVSPNSHLVNGQSVTVSWSGYTAGKVINILQCSAADSQLNNPSACDFTHAQILKADPTGSGSLSLTVITGKVGNGVCGPGHPGCFVDVNNASDPDPSASVRVPISFGG